MALSPLAGKPVPKESLVQVPALLQSYFDRKPDTSDPGQLVAFGTSGHRGSPLNATFTESHILAVAQAVCDYRHAQGIDGPLYLGKDTHAVSAPAERTALEVLAANGVETVIQKDDGVTPTPSVSRAILAHNLGRDSHLSDGIVVTPSHNPPEEGGIKYNAVNGGPADTHVTQWIQKRANELLASGNRDVKRLPYERALRAPCTHEQDLIGPYVEDLPNVLDMEAIRAARLKLAVDPLGGASIHYWSAIAERFGLDLTVVNQAVDPTFGFMTADHDGKIRMDCSSPYAMAGLLRFKDQYQLAFGNDPDADRHGIVTARGGLINPNHYLTVAIHYLVTRRKQWSPTAAIGKTVVSSALIDRVVRSLGRKLAEVPVGFKWFAGGLYDGSYCFGGEESAGASFVRLNGRAWTTDKDGILLDLLAAEILACTGKDPGVYYEELARDLGSPVYSRIDAPATPAQKAALSKLAPDAVRATTLAGEPIQAKLTRAPGNDAPIGGLKIVTENGWFAARPSGTENIYKIYAESFRDRAHLDAIVAEAQGIVDRALG
jgi:phosphoglucomutase